MSYPTVPAVFRQMFYETFDAFFRADRINAQPARKALKATWEQLREALFRAMVAMGCTIPMLGMTIWVVDLKLVDPNESPLFMALIYAQLVVLVVLTGWNSIILGKCISFAEKLSERKE